MFAAETISSFDQLILTLAGCFSQPTAQSFTAIAWGWVSCLGRRTLTQVISCAGERATKHIASYNRFFSKASWNFEEIWRVLLVEIVLPTLCPTGIVQIAIDDTTAQRWGRSIAFAAYFRDAVRSTRTRDVMHWSHNWVVACLVIRLPFWPTRVISLPIWAALYRREDDCKHGIVFKTRLELALEMIGKVREWIPERKIRIVADGAYASGEIIQHLPEGVHFMSRLRRDAALNALPPTGRRKGAKGHPVWKGPRLGPPADIAKAAAFDTVFIIQYGKRRKRLVHSFVALWYHVAKRTPVRIVIVRDPKGEEADDFFFTTDVDMSAKDVATLYSARWGIEEIFRDAKQSMGFESVHGWSPKTVERQAPFALLMLTLVRVAHIRLRRNQRTETLPTLRSMLLDLRLAEWRHQISCLSLSKEDSRLIEERLSVVLASVA